MPGARALALDSDTIKELVGKAFGIDHEALMHSRRGVENLPRDMAIYLQRKHCRQTLGEVGRDFNMANYSSVSSAFERVKSRLSKDRNMKAKAAKIERKLDKSQKQI